MNKQLTIVLTLALLGILSCANLFGAKDGDSNSTNHYAVLVAGSDGYWNYRHQADIGHAYKLLLANGIPAENIIVFAKDDIANSRQNPFPGKIFNKPADNEDGDVYAGLVIDYKGNDVTPANFLNVLLGDKDALSEIGSGRVLESTSNDNVFIYFSDHGATGLVAFPSEELYANDLNRTLTQMYEKNSYNKLVFYLEACESGSMFHKILSKDINVYATTAANPSQSSYAYYCGSEAKVAGVNIGSCLGDEYSIRWLEDSDLPESINNKTLKGQFEYLKDIVEGSEVHQYGSNDFEGSVIGEFQGVLDAKNQRQKANKNKGIIATATCKAKKAYKTVKNYFKNLLGYNTNQKTVRDLHSRATANERHVRPKVISSRDVKKNYLYEAAKSSNDEGDWDAYYIELARNKKSDHIFGLFDNTFNQNRNSAHVETIEFTCLKESVEAFKAICKNWGEYELKYVKNIAAACETNSSPSIAKFFAEICSNH